MAAMMQCVVGLSAQTSSIAGIPLQLSKRVPRRARWSCGGVGVFRVRGQAATEETEAEAAGGGGDEDDFEARLAKLQRKVTSGTGKKAELRKAKKEAGGDPYAAAGGGAPKKEDLFIPPVPLKEPVSDGVTVSLGVTPYTERFHGRLAALGLAAVLLVELATGDSFIKYHNSGTLTVQAYTVFGLAAVFVKYEKEKISVWPKRKSKE